MVGVGLAGVAVFLIAPPVPGIGFPNDQGGTPPLYASRKIHS